jgi:hypothetical protein
MEGALKKRQLIEILDKYYDQLTDKRPRPPFEQCTVMQLQRFVEILGFHEC